MYTQLRRVVCNNVKLLGKMGSWDTKIRQVEQYRKGISETFKPLNALLVSQRARQQCYLVI